MPTNHKINVPINWHAPIPDKKPNSTPPPTRLCVQGLLVLFRLAALGLALRNKLSSGSSQRRWDLKVRRRCTVLPLAL